MSHMSWLWI